MAAAGATKMSLLLLVVMACLGCTAPAHARIRIGRAPARPKKVYYNLTVTYGTWAPDCVQKQVYLINGQFPGPTLTATEGDTFVVTVVNKLSLEGLSIHWHGLTQRNNNLMDGTSFVTQCPIAPLDYFVYTFKADKAGTYMYHGHLDDQVSAGLYGQLIIKEPASKPFPYPYDGELSFILSDLWHRTVYEQAVGLDSIPFGWIGESQSLLINGRGTYNCSLIPAAPTTPVVGDVRTCNASSPQCGPPVLSVVPGKTYRVRIICITSLQSLNFAIEGHKLTIVQADDFGIKPWTVGNEGVDLYSGQTIDALLTANQTSRNYWVRSAVIARKNATAPGLAILNYNDSAAGTPTTTPPDTRAWNDYTFALAQANSYKADSTVPQVPTTAFAGYLLVGAQQKVNGYFRWAINNISYEVPPVPVALGRYLKLSSLYTPVPPKGVANPWNYSAPAPFEAVLGSGFYTFPLGRTIDIVLQNTNNIGVGSSETHPWHMHGHSFWVLAYGDGAWTSADTAKYNLVDPPFRNTVIVLPYGWVAIRVKVINPGTWFFHCHIAPHLHMGMAVVYVAGNPVPFPDNYARCGLGNQGQPL